MITERLHELEGADPAHLPANFIENLPGMQALASLKNKQIDRATLQTL